MNLKELRLKKKMTQMQVAVAVGVTLTAYINWEKGGCSPSPENLEKLKAVLGVEG
jgi:transcriptional regulator with XRE-family HTH domain